MNRSKAMILGTIGALALTVAVTPTLAPEADASLAGGDFCMTATGYEGSHTGKAGGCPVSEGDDSDGEGSTEPGNETPVENTMTVRQTINFTLQDPSYANASWTLRYRYGSDDWTEVKGEALASGYANSPIEKDREIRIGESYKAEPLEITLEASTGQRARWSVPAERFGEVLGTPIYDENYEEVRDENGDIVRDQPWPGVDAGFYATMIMFYQGEWTGAALPLEAS